MAQEWASKLGLSIIVHHPFGNSDCSKCDHTTHMELLNPPLGYIHTQLTVKIFKKTETEPQVMYWNTLSLKEKNVSQNFKYTGCYKRF